MTNKTGEGKVFTVACTNPTRPVSGGPVRVGGLTGIAVNNEGEGGVAATDTVVAFEAGLYELSVTDHAGGGIAIGDSLFYVDGAGDAAGTIENDPSGYFFGYANGTVAAGQTATIEVFRPGATGLALGAANVATANLADDAVTNAKLANITRGSVKVGGAANAPTDLDAKGAGKVLIGDGTDVKSLSVSVDGALAADGSLRVLKLGVSPKGTVVAQANNAVLAAGDLDKIHTNTGAGGGITLTLPAANANSGKFLKIAVTAAQTVQAIPAAGDKIYYGGSGVADKYAQVSGVIGNFMDLYSDGTDWLVINGNGVITKQA